MAGRAIGQSPTMIILSTVLDKIVKNKQSLYFVAAFVLPTMITLPGNKGKIAKTNHYILWIFSISRNLRIHTWVFCNTTYNGEPIKYARG